MFLVNTLGTKESQKTLNNIYSRLVVVILHTGDKKEKIQIEHNGTQWKKTICKEQIYILLNLFISNE